MFWLFGHEAPWSGIEPVLPVLEGEVPTSLPQPLDHQGSSGDW